MKCYGTLELIEFSPATAIEEPITLDEIKDFLNLPIYSPPDTSQDTKLESLIIAAREYAEVEYGADLVRKSYRLSMDLFPAIIHTRWPLAEVTAVRYRSSTGTWTELAEGTGYIVDKRHRPGLVMPPYSLDWPSVELWPSGAVEVEFEGGYATTDVFWSSTGQRILTGMKLLIAHWFNNNAPAAFNVSEVPHTITACLRGVPRP